MNIELGFNIELEVSYRVSFLQTNVIEFAFIKFFIEYGSSTSYRVSSYSFNIISSKDYFAKYQIRQ